MAKYIVAYALVENEAKDSILLGRSGLSVLKTEEANLLYNIQRRFRIPRAIQETWGDDMFASGMKAEIGYEIEPVEVCDKIEKSDSMGLWVVCRTVRKVNGIESRMADVEFHPKKSILTATRRRPEYYLTQNVLSWLTESKKK